MHLLRNVTQEIIYVAGTIAINPGEDLLIYDDATFELHPYIEIILASTENTYSNIEYGINYNIANSRLWYYVDDEYKVSSIFYSWLSEFKRKYSFFKKYKSTGFVDIKLDLINDLIIIDNSRQIEITDLPDHIPATKISTGVVSNEEFDTLSGINTETSIQEQIDAKSNIIHNHTYMFFLSTPSLIWTLNHGLHVKPVVEVFNMDGEIVVPTVKHENNDTVVMYFSKLTQVYANLTI